MKNNGEENFAIFARFADNKDTCFWSIDKFPLGPISVTGSI